MCKTHLECNKSYGMQNSAIRSAWDFKIRSFYLAICIDTKNIQCTWQKCLIRLITWTNILKTEFILKRSNVICYIANENIR